MVLSWKLDIARTGNVLGEIASTLHVDSHIFQAVNDEGRHPDRRNDTTDIDLAVHAHECGNGCRAGAEPREPSPPLLCGRVIHQGGREKGQGETGTPSLIDTSKKLLERLLGREPGR